MKIDWKITKERGNLRPKLWYRIALEPFEINLGVPMVRIASTIPKPPDSWQSHSYPGRMERGDWQPDTFYYLCSPSHKTGCCEEVITLPMRENGEYPEVEESFLKLRQTYEKVLIEAYENADFKTEGSLWMSIETKKRIAPGIAAARLLEAAGFECQKR